MNIKEYISSGIIESYVLGLAAADERLEFERMCKEHLAVREARNAFELELEAKTLADSIKAPEHIKNQLLSKLNISASESDLKSVPINSEQKAAKEKLSANLYSASAVRYMAAAAVVLLIGSVALNLYFFSQVRNYSRRYEQLVASQSELAKNNQVLRTELLEFQSTVAMMKNPEMVMIKMQGSNVPKSPDTTSNATVFWNSRSKDVYLMVNNLPIPAGSKQYQLWAIVDGKPVDAGVFDMTGAAAPMRMKNIPRAQIFAITLEEKGGSDSPKGPMYVMGKV